MSAGEGRHRRQVAPGQLLELFNRLIPFNRFLGIRGLEVADGVAVLEIPFRAELIGNPVTPSLHGGVISTLLDTCGGVAVWSRVAIDDLVSTVDLRVDYLRPGRAEDLLARGAVVRLGNRVSVVELRAFHRDDEDNPVAMGTGVYNIRRAAAKASEELWKRLDAPGHES